VTPIEELQANTYLAGFSKGLKVVPLEIAERVVHSIQAKIDGLMLEYCPEEMTGEQLKNWAVHQKPVSDGLDAAINKAIRG
jgi:hypothetical protein